MTNQWSRKASDKASVQPAACKVLSCLPVYLIHFMFAMVASKAFMYKCKLVLASCAYCAADHERDVCIQHDFGMF